MAGPRRRSGDPSRGSILMTVAPRSASKPPASSPATVCASSRTTTPSRVPPRSAPGSAENSVVIRPSGQPEHARGVLVEPLLLDGVLERQVHVLVDQGLVRLADQPRRKADQHLVLDQRVAELHQHLPARAGLTEILRAMRR